MRIVDAPTIFIKVCICNGSSLVRAVTNYGRHNSLLGHNLLFCAQIYRPNCSAKDIISGSVNRRVNNYTSKLVEDY